MQFALPAAPVYGAKAATLLSTSSLMPQLTLGSLVDPGLVHICNQLWEGSRSIGAILQQPYFTTPISDIITVDSFLILNKKNSEALQSLADRQLRDTSPPPPASSPVPKAQPSTTPQPSPATPASASKAGSGPTSASPTAAASPANSDNARAAAIKTTVAQWFHVAHPDPDPLVAGYQRLTQALRLSKGVEYQGVDLMVAFQALVSEAFKAFGVFDQLAARNNLSSLYLVGLLNKLTKAFFSHTLSTACEKLLAKPWGKMMGNMARITSAEELRNIITHFAANVPATLGSEAAWRVRCCRTEWCTPMHPPAQCTTAEHA